MELSKYIKFESVELQRSTIRFADYNPRLISEDEKKSIKRGIKKFGIVGGIIVNKRTMTIVSGHQRVSIMDELQKYVDGDENTDYLLRVDTIDVDDKTEKSLNILLNNPNAQGKWDNDKLREIIPDIDYKDSGLTDSDLSLIGCDYLLKTEEENNIEDEINSLNAPIQEKKEELKSERKAEREAKIQHMKDVKKQVKDEAMQQAGNMDAYVMLSFDTIEAKGLFLQRFNFPTDSKFIKGEDFDDRCEAVLD